MSAQNRLLRRLQAGQRSPGTGRSNLHHRQPPRLEQDRCQSGSAFCAVRDFRTGSPVCVTATLFDGLVLARAARYHSMNYRSATIHGAVVQVTEATEVMARLRAI